MQPLALSLSLALLVAAPACAQTMQVSPNGSRASVAGAPANFTGAGCHAALRTKFANQCGWRTGRVRAGRPLGLAHASRWLVQQEGGEKIAIKPGDVIWTPPGVMHWHGATANNSMSHIAITPTVDGKNVDWMEPVTDEQYRR